MRGYTKQLVIHMFTVQYTQHSTCDMGNAQIKCKYQNTGLCWLVNRNKTKKHVYKQVQNNTK